MKKSKIKAFEKTTQILTQKQTPQIKGGRSEPEPPVGTDPYDPPSEP